MSLVCAQSEAGYAGEDLIGGLDTKVGRAGPVMDIDELADRGDEFAHAAVPIAAELLGGQGREPAFG